MARHHDSGDTTAHRGGKYYVNGEYFHGSSEFANMPEGTTMKYYPRENVSGVHQPLDDTMTGIDMMQSETKRTSAKHLSNLKV